jgi:hypothetical protein
VGGATALGHDYFRKKKLDVRFTPYSLGWQTSWLKKRKWLTCFLQSKVAT